MGKKEDELEGAKVLDHRPELVEGFRHDDLALLDEEEQTEHGEKDAEHGFKRHHQEHDVELWCDFVKEAHAHIGDKDRDHDGRRERQRSKEQVRRKPSNHFKQRPESCIKAREARERDDQIATQEILDKDQMTIDRKEDDDQQLVVERTDLRGGGLHLWNKTAAHCGTTGGIDKATDHFSDMPDRQDHKAEQETDKGFFDDVTKKADGERKARPDGSKDRLNDVCIRKDGIHQDAERESDADLDLGRDEFASEKRNQPDHTEDAGHHQANDHQWLGEVEVVNGSRKFFHVPTASEVCVKSSTRSVS